MRDNIIVGNYAAMEKRRPMAKFPHLSISSVRRRASPESQQREISPASNQQPPTTGSFSEQQRLEDRFETINFSCAKTLAFLIPLKKKRSSEISQLRPPPDLSQSIWGMPGARGKSASDANGKAGCKPVGNPLLNWINNQIVNVAANNIYKTIKQMIPESLCELAGSVSPSTKETVEAFAKIFCRYLSEVCLETVSTYANLNSPDSMSSLDDVIDTFFKPELEKLYPSLKDFSPILKPIAKKWLEQFVINNSRFNKADADQIPVSVFALATVIKVLPELNSQPRQALDKLLSSFISSLKSKFMYSGQDDQKFSFENSVQQKFQNPLPHRDLKISPKTRDQTIFERVAELISLKMSGKITDQDIRAEVSTTISRIKSSELPPERKMAMQKIIENALPENSSPIGTKRYLPRRRTIVEHTFDKNRQQVLLNICDTDLRGWGNDIQTNERGVKAQEWKKIQKIIVKKMTNLPTTSNFETFCGYEVDANFKANTGKVANSDGGPRLLKNLSSICQGNKKVIRTASSFLNINAARAADSLVTGQLGQRPGEAIADMFPYGDQYLQLETGRPPQSDFYVDAQQDGSTKITIKCKWPVKGYSTNMLGEIKKASASAHSSLTNCTEIHIGPDGAVREVGGHFAVELNTQIASQWHPGAVLTRRELDRQLNEVNVKFGCIPWKQSQSGESEIKTLLDKYHKTTNQLHHPLKPARRTFIMSSLSDQLENLIAACNKYIQKPNLPEDEKKIVKALEEQLVREKACVNQQISSPSSSGNPTSPVTGAGESIQEMLREAPVHREISINEHTQEQTIMDRAAELIFLHRERKISNEQLRHQIDVLEKRIHFAKLPVAKKQQFARIARLALQELDGLWGSQSALGSSRSELQFELDGATKQMALRVIDGDLRTMPPAVSENTSKLLQEMYENNSPREIFEGFRVDGAFRRDVGELAIDLKGTDITSKGWDEPNGLTAEKMRELYVICGRNAAMLNSVTKFLNTDVQNIINSSVIDQMQQRTGEQEPDVFPYERKFLQLENPRKPQTLLQVQSPGDGSVLVTIQSKWNIKGHSENLQGEFSMVDSQAPSTLGASATIRLQPSEGNENESLIDKMKGQMFNLLWSSGDEPKASCSIREPCLSVSLNTGESCQWSSGQIPTGKELRKSATPGFAWFPQKFAPSSLKNISKLLDRYHTSVKSATSSSTPDTAMPTQDDLQNQLKELVIACDRHLAEPKIKKKEKEALKDLKAHLLREQVLQKQETCSIFTDRPHPGLALGPNQR